MQSTAIKLSYLLENLEEDYDKAVSYIEFLVSTRKKEQTQRGKTVEAKEDVDAIVDSLIGAIPDMGKTLEEFRAERLKKYENPC